MLWEGFAMALSLRSRDDASASLKIRHEFCGTSGDFPMLAELRLGLLAFPTDADLFARPAGRCSSRNFQEKLGPNYVVLPDGRPGTKLAAYLMPVELAARRDQTKALIVCNESAGAVSFEVTKEEKALCVISAESGAAEILRNDKARLLCQIPCLEDDLRSRVHDGYKLEGEFPGRAGFSIRVSCVHETLEGEPQDLQCHEGRWDNLTVKCSEKILTTTTTSTAAPAAETEATAQSANASVSEQGDGSDAPTAASDTKNQTSEVAEAKKVVADAAANTSAEKVVADAAANTSETTAAAHEDQAAASDKVAQDGESAKETAPAATKSTASTNTSETSTEKTAVGKDGDVADDNLAQDAQVAEAKAEAAAKAAAEMRAAAAANPDDPELAAKAAKLEAEAAKLRSTADEKSAKAKSARQSAASS